MSFITFLNDILRQNKIDEKVFGPYIIGILQGADETLEEKREALREFISELIEKDIEKFVEEIFERWTNAQPAEEKKEDAKVFDIDEQLAKLLESKKITIQERTLTAEEKRIKQQILATYSQCSDKEEDDDASDNDENESADPNLQKNTNKSDVQQLQKEKREQAKLESAAKKLKDKDDRAKQKKLREEKAEKRKTVKGERKR